MHVVSGNGMHFGEPHEFWGLECMSFPGATCILGPKLHVVPGNDKMHVVPGNDVHSGA